ncbi:hypothetical protein BST28_08245 [Mycolicibacter kumamotonensis]|uniref:Scaffolding protein n=1 Tax=Mycolicibacter kumamotonensis TaxID=354243 RepID=A0A1X0E7T7_9MYCO|nr:hypothetical protein [Mycolicibacter kumamotonensis]ORA80743.1 hypothetical protein BST28_08245 [Mycolicibacter kumamotonensis]
MTDTDTTTTDAPADTEATETAETAEAQAVEPDSATDTDAQDETVEQFGRDYVEKLRRESAGYRERATTAETTVAALQQQHAERLIDAAGVKPAAVFAVAELADLLADDGTVDPEKVTTAVTRARQELGVVGHAQPLPPRGGLTSGIGAQQSKPNSWQSAFAPPER